MISRAEISSSRRRSSSTSVESFNHISKLPFFTKTKLFTVIQSLTVLPTGLIELIGEYHTLLLWPANVYDAPLIALRINCTISGSELHLLLTHYCRNLLDRTKVASFEKLNPYLVRFVREFFQIRRTEITLFHVWLHYSTIPDIDRLNPRCSHGFAEYFWKVWQICEEYGLDPNTILEEFACAIFIATLHTSISASMLWKSLIWLSLFNSLPDFLRYLRRGYFYTSPYNNNILACQVQTLINYVWPGIIAMVFSLEDQKSKEGENLKNRRTSSEEYYSKLSKEDPDINSYFKILRQVSLKRAVSNRKDVLLNIVYRVYKNLYKEV